MSEDRELVEYGLRPAQEEFLKEYLQTGDVEKSAHAVHRRPSTCRKWLKDPKFQQALQRELSQKLNGGAISALDTMMALIHNAGDDKVRLQAAKDVLDRAGYKPEHLHTSADKRMENANVEEMMGRIKELQRELGMEAKGPVIEGEASTPDGLPEPPKPDDPDPVEPVAQCNDLANAETEIDEQAQAEPEEPATKAEPEEPTEPENVESERAEERYDPVEETDIEDIL